MYARPFTPVLIYAACESKLAGNRQAFQFSLALFSGLQRRPRIPRIGSYGERQFSQSYACLTPAVVELDAVKDPP